MISKLTLIYYLYIACGPSETAQKALNLPK